MTNIVVVNAMKPPTEAAIAVTLLYLFQSCITFVFVLILSSVIHSPAASNLLNVWLVNFAKLRLCA